MYMSIKRKRQCTSSSTPLVEAFPPLILLIDMIIITSSFPESVFVLLPILLLVLLLIINAPPPLVVVIVKRDIAFDDVAHGIHETNQLGPLVSQICVVRRPMQHTASTRLFGCEQIRQCIIP